MKWQRAPTSKKNPDWLSVFIFNPLKSLIFPFILIMAVAIITTSVATYQVHRHNLRESLFTQTEVRAQNYRDIIQNYLAKNLDTLLNHARNLAGRYNIRQEIWHLLAEPHQTSSFNALNKQLNHIDYDFGLSNISLLNKRGQVVFNRGRKANFNPNDTDIAAVLKGHESRDIVQEGTTWLLLAAVPIQEKNNTIGALILTIELNLPLDEFAELNQIGLALADKNGIQAIGNTSANSIIFDKEKVENVFDEDAIQNIIDLQRNRLFNYTGIQVGSHRFVLINQIGLGPIAQILRQKKQEVLQSTLIVLAILLPLSALLVHLLLRPLITLRKRTSSVAKKLTGISLEDYRGHEINQLVYAFDDMASALEKHEEARQKAESLLQQEHATLEVKVKDRTQELEQANNLLVREISERTRAQQKAESLQKFLASFINAMPSLLIGIDHNGHINQWNLEAEKFSGLNYAQVNGRPFVDVLPWLDQLQPKIRDTLQQGIPTKLPHMQWPMNNIDKLVDVMIYPLSFEQQGGVVIRIDDVTERIRLDELIMQTEKMLSVGGLAAGMAHEINNPLASIIQSAQVICQRLSPDLPKNRSCAENIGTSLDDINTYLNERQIHKMLTSILDSGQRAGEIVKNMLSFTRGSDSIRSTLKISDLLDRAVEQASQDYDLKKHHNIRQVKIVRNYDENLPKIMCNSSQIEQVFFNMIQNSAQALSAAAEMTAPPCIELATSRQENMLLISICDNGSGIDMETQKRIFEPFFTTKDVGLGTGLGLSVSYFIITENHGGQLNVESSPGKGTRFNILLPLNDLTVKQ